MAAVAPEPSAVASAVAPAAPASDTPNVAPPLSVVLLGKLSEFDLNTTGLATPQAGSKVVKSGDSYSFQQPGYSQSIYRWLAGESQDTTKQYVEDLSTRLVDLISLSEDMLTQFATSRRMQQVSRFTRAQTQRDTMTGLRALIPPSPEQAPQIDDIAEVLRKVDEMVSRMQLAITHVRDLYCGDEEAREAAREAEKGLADATRAQASSSDGGIDDGSEGAIEAEPDGGSPAPPALPKEHVYDQWLKRLSDAHAELCTCSASFRA